LQNLDGLIGNTYDAHRMVAQAKHQGKVSQFKEALWRM
jgi:predicted DsbA family dithiol-disulfide isomerase